MSDHRPVTATFQVQVTSIDPSLFSVVEAQAQSKIKSILKKEMEREQKFFLVGYFMISEEESRELLSSKPFADYFP